ncbi:hypothetical protein NQ315_004834, partial [Exocentrus adspersus]
MWLQVVVSIILSIVLMIVETARHCELPEQLLQYYKLRDCYRSSLPVVATARVDGIEDCINFGRQRKALALNFSPNDASSYRNFSVNCQALGCPETEKSITLIADVAFEYHSAYGKWNMTENATCIRSVGLFTAIEEKQNYTASIEKCQTIGAHLANVISEVRTNHLSEHINNTLQDWYKVAYVGLDDMQHEGNFKTATNGSLLRCFKYRAWGPGHPISKHRNEDCVVLDTESTWRVVDCRRRFPALCEFYPAEPAEMIDFRNITCDQITDE